MKSIRSFLFWCGFSTSTILVTFLIFVFFFTPFSFRFRLSRLWPAFNLWWLKLTCGLDYRIRGLENIPATPCIFMSKHQSTWETIALQKFLPPMVWVMKRELLWIPIFGWGVYFLRPIAINRGKSKKAVDQLIEQGRTRLQEGICVMIFPEGTRTLPGSKPHYRIGGALLAEKTGYPVVPIAHTAGYYWPRLQWHKHPGTIEVVIGEPIPTQGKKAQQVLHETRDWIEAQMEQIRPQAKDDTSTP